MSKKKNQTAPDPATPPEPEAVPIPSRSVLLNRFAKLQEKVSRLTYELKQTKANMLWTAGELRDHYGIVVSDVVHTTPVPLISSVVPSVATPSRVEVAEEEDFIPLAPEDNPMLKAAAAQGVIIDSPRTAPASSERDVAAIRKAAKLDKDSADNPDAFRASIANTMGNLASAVKGGMGKAVTAPATRPKGSK